MPNTQEVEERVSKSFLATDVFIHEMQTYILSVLTAIHDL